MSDHVFKYFTTDEDGHYRCKLCGSRLNNYSCNDCATVAWVGVCSHLGEAHPETYRTALELMDQERTAKKTPTSSSSRSQPISTARGAAKAYPKQGAAKKTRAKGGRVAKDPNAPKRAMPAYFLWLKENRSRLKKPGMSVTDVVKVAGAEWNALSDKSEWENAAAEDKNRYKMEIAAYRKKGEQNED